MNRLSITFRQLMILLGCWVLVPHPAVIAQERQSFPAADSLKTARVSAFVGYILDGFSSKYAVAAGGNITTSAACGAFQFGHGTSLEIGVGYARDFSPQLGARGLFSFRKGTFQQSFN